MKILHIFFLLLPFVSFGQEVENISKFYQEILDHPDFVDLIEARSELKCGNTLLTKEEYQLTYNDIALQLVNPENDSCSLISYKLTKKSGNIFIIEASITYAGLVGQCMYSTTVHSQLKLRKKKRRYKICNLYSFERTSYAKLM